MKKVKPTITVMCFLSAMVLGAFYHKAARAQESIKLLMPQVSEAREAALTVRLH